MNCEDTETFEVVGALNDPSSAVAVTAERVFLEVLGGGCQVPIGALGVPYGTKLRLWGLVVSPDGSRLVRGDLTGELTDPEKLGRRLADLLRSRGAEGILKRMNANQGSGWQGLDPKSDESERDGRAGVDR